MNSTFKATRLGTLKIKLHNMLESGLINTRELSELKKLTRTFGWRNF